MRRGSVLRPRRVFNQGRVCVLRNFSRSRHDVPRRAMQPSAVIVAERRHLEARCRERGWTLDEVADCVVARDGDSWTIDTAHPAYPRAAKPGWTPSPPAGPGTEMKKLLAAVGIVASENCPCEQHARQMDAWGADECGRRVNEIVGWLRAEAAERGLPFLDSAGRMLVRLAIRNARNAKNPG